MKTMSIMTERRASKVFVSHRWPAISARMLARAEVAPSKESPELKKDFRDAQGADPRAADSRAPTRTRARSATRWLSLSFQKGVECETLGSTYTTRTMLMIRYV